MRSRILPKLGRRFFPNPGQRIPVVRALLLGLLICATPPARARYVPQPCKNAYTPEQEIVEGQKAKAQVYKSMPVLPDSNQVSRYVQGLGAKLVANAPGYQWPYEFHVVDATDINAFALPGGPVFVNLGTVQAAETEAQLAGVMAHEISHVVQRHATCNITKEQKQSVWWGLGQMAAGVLLPGVAGAAAQTGIGFGAQSVFLRMSRDSEKQADLMGTDILYDSGYDPRGLPQFFEVIQAKEGEGGSQFLSDHPNPGNRVGYVQDEIDTLPRKPNAVKTTAEFTRIHTEAMALHAYTAKEIQSGAWKTQSPNEPTGAVLAASLPATTSQPVNYAPSGRYKELQTPEYSIAYPDNWTAVVASESSAATIAPQGGILTRPDAGDSVVYGVLVDSATEQPGTALDAAFAQLVQGVTQQNAGLAQDGVIEDVVVNKRPGKSLELVGRSPMIRNGEPLLEHDWLVAVQRPDGNLNYAIFIAPGGDASALRPTFEQMLRSLKVK